MKPTYDEQQKFIDRGRMNKAKTILASIPHDDTREEILQTAARLEAMTEYERKMAALKAGVKKAPSPETWAIVVRLAYGRKTLEEIETERGE